MSLPPDRIIEAQVDAAIMEGFPLPRWGWKVPRPYNGSTGPERIAGWQKVVVARRIGLLANDEPCGVCGTSDAPQRHGEIYARPLTAQPICRSCHYHVHRRFREPEQWQERLSTMPAAQWAHALPLVELTRVEALQIAEAVDVFEALARHGPFRHSTVRGAARVDR